MYPFHVFLSIFTFKCWCGMELLYFYCWLSNSLISWQIFQQLTNESLNTPLLPSSLGISDAVGAPVKGIQFRNSSGDPSAFDGASILASLSNPRNDGSVIASPASNDGSVQQGLERPTPSPELDSSCHVLKGCPELNGNTGIPSADNTAAVISADLPSNDPFNLGSDACLDAVPGKISAMNCELRPFLRMLAGSSTSELDLSGSVLKAFEDPRELHENLDSRALLPTSKSQAFKDCLKQGILNASDIEVSFDNFPYYLRYLPYLSFYFFFCYHLIIQLYHTSTLVSYCFDVSVFVFT